LDWTEDAGKKLVAADLGGRSPDRIEIELHTDAPAGASVDPSSKFVTEEFDRITASARLTRGVWTRRIDLGGSKP
jgi:hypothetical protein